MSHWEAAGLTDEWLTPRYVFDALDAVFDVDVAPSPSDGHYVPALRQLKGDALTVPWPRWSWVWMNPPFGGRNGLQPWLERFFDHGHGVALTPDRTSAPWYGYALARADALLIVAKKIRFLRPDGTPGRAPSTGTTLWAAGDASVRALVRAEENGLGVIVTRPHTKSAP